jgi:uncharacterized membrane protein
MGGGYGLVPEERNMKLVVVIAVISCAACGTGSASIDCSAATIPSFTKVTAFAQCTSCHSSTLSASARQGAPVGVDFDTYAAAVNNIDSGLREIEDGRMPPSNTLSTDELTQIETWASCGEPQ